MLVAKRFIPTDLADVLKDTSSAREAGTLVLLQLLDKDDGYGAYIYKFLTGPSTSACVVEVYKGDHCRPQQHGAAQRVVARLALQPGPRV